MIEPLIELPPHVRKRLATALRTGTLGEPYSTSAIRSALGISDGGQRLCDALAAIAGRGVNAAAVAGWLEAIESASVRTAPPDLVWSGPEVPGLHARSTRRVYEDLVELSTTSVIASTFAFFDGPRAFDVLARRMEKVPNLKVALFLNIQRRRGDTTDGEQLVRQFTDRFWRTDWPGSARPDVYYDPRSLSPDGPEGVLHAKCMIVDDEMLFVTSANLTEAALDRNIELGLLVRDRTLAVAAGNRFRGLIERGLLSQLPSR